MADSSNAAFGWGARREGGRKRSLSIRPGKPWHLKKTHSLSVWSGREEGRKEGKKAARRKNGLKKKEKNLKSLHFFSRFLRDNTNLLSSGNVSGLLRNHYRKFNLFCLFETRFLWHFSLFFSLILDLVVKNQGENSSVCVKLRERQWLKVFCKFSVRSGGNWT